MKPQTGSTSFAFTTSDDRELDIEANVYFTPEGESLIDSIEVSEDGESIEFESLDDKDKNAIEAKACYDAVPQDEVYDEYEELEFE